MRTTVTLDPEVQSLIRTAMNERGISFKEALNSAVKLGLTHHKVKGSKFEQKAHSLGGEQNFRWDKALEVAAALEDEESGRKLSLRK
jgi:hypothetical protein